MSQHRKLISRAEAQAPFFVGLDLGGTNIKVGLVDDTGRTLVYQTIPTEVERGAEDASRRMGLCVVEMIAKAGLITKDVARVGLGSAGPMDVPGGKLFRPTNLKGWDFFPLRDRVSHHSGLPVTFANDARAAAFGEAWIGSGRGLNSLVLLTLGTGIGCGIILGDQVLDGEHSYGGEFAHTIIDYSKDARPCACGGIGHYEAYTSATSVIKRAQEAMAAGRTTSLSAKIAAGAELTPKLVGQEAEAGDTVAMDIIVETAAFLGIGIVNLMNTIDPHGILIGGAMTFGGKGSPLGRRFMDRIKEEVARRGFPILVEKTTLDFATLGGDAGYIGAAGLARRDHRRQHGVR